ncbi:hypothetical protein GBA52_004911 [Prunus armeniaca]|nr:hypothetical protein GBA52_004911 [Prunus armeniaca]
MALCIPPEVPGKIVQKILHIDASGFLPFVFLILPYPHFLSFQGREWKAIQNSISCPFNLISSNLAKLRTRKLLLADLPNDIILNILTRLPTQSICRIQCISKSFFNLVDCSFFATLHTSRCINNPGVVEVPQLMLITSSRTRHDKFTMVFRSLKYNGDYVLREIKYSFLVSKILKSLKSFRARFDFPQANLFFWPLYVCLPQPLLRGILSNVLPTLEQISKQSSNPMLEKGKKKRQCYSPTVGLEPTTTRLRALRSTN